MSIQSLIFLAQRVYPIQSFSWLFKYFFISSGSYEIVEILLHAGADQTVKMGVPADQTPLRLAEELGHEQIVKLLG